jgi:hypothetical protein
MISDLRLDHYEGNSSPISSRELTGRRPLKDKSCLVPDKWQKDQFR